MPKIHGRNAHQLRTKEMGDDWIDREAILGDHHLRFAVEQSVRDKLDDFIRAIAQNEICRLHAELFRQLALEVECVAIRIKMRLLQTFLDGSESERRGAE